MLTAEVLVPMFLPNVEHMMLHQAWVQLAQDGEAEVGDQIETKFLGMTRDPADGWPLKRYRVSIYKAR